MKTIYPFLNRSVHCSNEKFPLITEKGIKDKLANETGWDRVKRMYAVDGFGYSPEIYNVITTGKFIVGIAAVFGGVGSMVKAQENFSLRNKKTQFESQHVAKRSLTDAMARAFIKGGSTSALKYGSFSCFYLLSTMTIANYRNKISMWEHAATAAVLGGFSKINYGLKGFAIAGALGGVFGLIAGGVISMTMKAGGMTMDDFRCWLHEDHYMRLKEQRLKEVKGTS